MTTFGPSSFGAQLRRLRVDAGLSQEALAERAGLSARGISDLERGARSRPRSETLRLLADALGLRGDDRAAFLGVPAAAPAPPKASGSAGRLPEPFDDPIGRERDRVQLATLLADPAVRLVTLTGPGGVGKSRLAIAVASDAAAAFRDGVVFVGLTPLRDPALVETAIAAAVGIPESGRGGIEASLAAGLRNRHALLVLDNMEHLLDAAPAVGRLLAACPLVRVLATSRMPLRIRGEHCVAVSPLPTRPTPGVEAGARSPAERLFIRRARQIDPAFDREGDHAEAVVEICRRLDGLPLAIELAAARTALFSPPALLARLDHRLPLLNRGAADAPERQRTMAGAIAWSHDLLAPGERIAFRRLAVFAGGFTVEAATAVVGAVDWPAEGDPAPEETPTSTASAPARLAERDRPAPATAERHPNGPDQPSVTSPPDADATIDRLAALVESSLLGAAPGRGGDARFRMLETVREFGLERLAAHGELERTRRLHLDWCLRLAETAAPHLYGPAEAGWLPMLDAEHDNLRAALAWAEEIADGDALARLAAALWRFWYVRGHVGDGQRWLRLAREAAPVAMRGRVAIGGAWMSHLSGDDEGARVLASLAAGDAAVAGDGPTAATAAYTLGKIAADAGAYDEAEQRFAAALAGYRAANDRVRIGLTLNHLGCVALGQEAYAKAEALLYDALAVHDDVGWPHARAIAVLYLGHLALARNVPDRAAASYRQCLDLWVAEGFRPGLLETVSAAAAVRQARGQPAEAAVLFGAADRQRTQFGLPAWQPEATLYDRALAGVRRDLPPDRFATAWASGQSLDLDEATALAREAVAGG